AEPEDMHQWGRAAGEQPYGPLPLGGLRLRDVERYFYDEDDVPVIGDLRVVRHHHRVAPGGGKDPGRELHHGRQIGGDARLDGEGMNRRRDGDRRGGRRCGHRSCSWWGRLATVRLSLAYPLPPWRATRIRRRGARGRARETSRLDAQRGSSV